MQLGVDVLTSASSKSSSTSSTSHQFSIRHNGPIMTGLVARYVLNNAVSTTWATRANWSGSSRVNGSFGRLNSSEGDARVRGEEGTGRVGFGRAASACEYF